MAVDPVEMARRILVLEEATNGYAGDMDRRMGVVREEMEEMKKVMDGEYANRINDMKTLMNATDNAIKGLQDTTNGAKLREDAYKVELEEVKRCLGQVVVVKTELEEVVRKVRMLENNGVGGGGAWMGGKVQHLIHPKHMMPDKFEDGKEREWRKWRDEMESYVEQMRPMIKDRMREAKDEDDPVEVDDVEEPDSKELHMLLKNRTGGEAYRIVVAVGNGNGLEAWRRLHKHFEPEVGVRIAQTQAEFTMMVNRQAKDPKELKVLLLEMEERMRRVEEVTETKINDDYSRSVLTCIHDGPPDETTHDQQSE